MLGIGQWWSRVPVGTRVLFFGLGALVVAVTVLLIVEHARPQMDLLVDSSLDAGQRGRIAAFLQREGVPHTVTDRGIHVPAERRPQVIASLRVHGLLPRDSATGAGGFAALAAHKPAWYLSSEQNRQLYNLALQDELSRVVGGYPGVRSATVIISHPQSTGFAATHRRPSASVNVEMESGGLDPRTVNAIAGLVSGSVAEMHPQDVAVIDATAGRQFKTRTEGDALAGDAHELKQGIEQAVRQKIVEALSYIDGVIVAVNAEVDIIRRQTASDLVDPLRTLELRLGERTETFAERPREGESPVRTADRNERQFQPAISRRHETSVDPGGLPTRISATVNVPRSFIVAGYRRVTGRAAAEPTDAELQPTVDEQLARIRRQVEPLVLSREPGQVVIDVYPDTRPVVAASSLASPPLPPATARSPWTTLVFWSQNPWPAAAAVIVVLIVMAAMLRRRPLPAAVVAEGRERRPTEVFPGALLNEHPQTIALCLSRMSEAAAAELLITLPEDVQADVLDRMARIAEPDPQVVREVDEYLACRAAEGTPVDPGRIESLDDAVLRAVIEEVERDQLVAALRVASDELRQRIARQLPADEARNLRRELARPVPVRLSEIEAAQCRILEVAGQYGDIAGLAA